MGLMQSEPCKRFGDLVKNGDFCYLFFFFSWMHLEVTLESMILSISPFFPSGLFFLRHYTQADNPKETNISTRSNHTTEVKSSPLVFTFSNSGQTSNKASEDPLHPSALKLPPPCWALSRPPTQDTQRKVGFPVKPPWLIPSFTHLLSSRTKRAGISIGARATFGTFRTIFTSGTRRSNFPLLTTREALMGQAGPRPLVY